MDKQGTSAGSRSAVICWEIPDRDTVIEFARETLDGLLIEALSGLGLLARGRGVEAGGILLGWTHNDGRLRRIRIEDFRAIACQHAHGPSYALTEAEQEQLRRLAAAWARKPGRPRYFVGYWRSHARGPLALRKEDRELLEGLRAMRAEIALLIEPHGAGPGTAAVFLVGDGEGASTLPAVTREIMPARSAKARRDGSRYEHADPHAPPTIERGRPEAPAEEPADFRFSMFEARSDRAPKVPRRRRRWLVAAVVLAVLSGAAAVAVQGGYLRLPAAARAQDPYALGLRVERRGDNLLVAWDRHSRALAVAEQGSLTIADGDRLQVIELDREQLWGGSVIYRPIGDRVSFRLELRWGHRALIEATSWEQP